VSTSVGRIGIALVTLLSIVGSAHAEVPPPRLVKLSWSEAIQRAVGRNPTAVVAAKEIERADALVRQARAAWLPTLTATGSNTRLDSARTSGGIVVTPASTWNGNLDLSVPIIAPLAWMGDAHARDNRDVAATNATDVQRQVASATARAYLETLLQHRQVEVAGRSRDSARVHFDYTHERLVRGLGNSIDDARAAQELRASEVQLETAEAALVRAQSALAILVSEPALVDVADDTPLAAAAAEQLAAVDPRGRRTDVRLLEARRQATAHLRRDDWAFYAPTLLADVQAFQETRTSAAPGSGWQASLILSIPLFDGGNRYGVQRERRALDEEATVELEGLLRQANVEVRAAVEVLRRTDASLASARAGADDARTAAVLADKAYRAGATTNIEVIDAERQARDAESQAAIAEDGARQARLDLLVATGAFP
jgi:outer membrane protein TolC